MRFWKRAKETPVVNPYMGKFTDWTFTDYIASAPENEFALWIANEFYGFKDSNIEPRGRKRLLIGAPDAERRRIYDALMAERDARVAEEREKFRVKAAIARLELLDSGPK